MADFGFDSCQLSVIDVHSISGKASISPTPLNAAISLRTAFEHNMIRPASIPLLDPPLRLTEECMSSWFKFDLTEAEIAVGLKERLSYFDR
jgi:hypothetical protein